METNTITKGFFNPVSLTVIITLFCTGFGLYYTGVINIPVLIAILILTIFISGSIYIVDQWEKAVVLRMGKYIGLKGPGMFMIIPILDKIHSL